MRLVTYKNSPPTKSKNTSCTELLFLDSGAENKIGKHTRHIQRSGGLAHPYNGIVWLFFFLVRGCCETPPWRLSEYRIMWEFAVSNHKDRIYP